jgi:hypothetical protein
MTDYLKKSDNDSFWQGKSDKLRFVLWVKSDSDIYYNKTSDKAATKLVTSDLGYTLGGPLAILWIYTQSNITQASYSPEYITPTQQAS